MRQAIFLFFELFHFACYELCLGELIILPLQVVGIGLCFLGKGLCLTQGCGGIHVCGICVVVCFAFSGIACDGIYYLYLKQVIAYHQTLVLRMDVNELTRKSFKFGLGHYFIVDKRTRTTILIQLAADDNLAFRLIAPKCRFDDTAFFTFGDAFDVGTCTHHEVERTENNALTSTCLTRHHGESLMEINVQMRDQSIVAYM